MIDNNSLMELFQRGGADTWDQPAAGSILSTELFDQEPQGLTPRRALYLSSGVMGEVPTALLGTGLKPIVILTDGTRKERAEQEGTPLILVNGAIRTLNAATESLSI